MNVYEKGDRLKFYYRLSYQKKLLVFMMSMVVFMGGAMGLLIRLVIFPHLTHEMENRGTTVARRLAESARTFILTRDRVSLTALLFEEKHLEQNIAYIVVSDTEDHPLAHTFVGVTPQSSAASQVVSESWASGLASSLALASEGRIADIIAPVYEGLYQIGAIRVGLDRRFINRVIRELSLYHFGFVGATTLVGLFFGLYLSRVITRPITSLTKLVGDISLGNLNTHISLGREERCWELTNCGEKDCPAFGGNVLRCWFVDDTTPCKRTSLCKFPEKLEECRKCPVYKTLAGDEIVQLADAFNHMTSRLRASELEVRRSEERYRLLFNSDPNPIFVIDIDTYAVVDTNERGTEEYGYPREELLGMSFTDLGFEEDSQRIISTFKGMDRASKSCSLVPRIRHRRRDGTTLWVNIYFCSYEFMGKQHVIATATDTTEIIETETMLIQAGKMTTLGEMAAGVAHELNQPLNAIKVGSEFLQTMMEQGRAIRDEDLQAVTREISKEIDRASGIINHLREFGRKSSIEWHRIDINRPIRGVFTILGQQLKVHGIQVLTELDGSLPPVLADGNRLEQVLINLINNARDAMEARGESEQATGANILTVRSFVEKDRVVVTVSDTGAGIPAAIQDRIFEPFYTTKPVGKGTGLGLSISYGIVRDYDGAIDFVTEEGAGTTFRLSFPAAPDEN